MTAPLDANGKPLKVGDEILVRAKVVHVVGAHGKKRAAVIFQWEEDIQRDGVGTARAANVEIRK